MDETALQLLDTLITRGYMVDFDHMLTKHIRLSALVTSPHRRVHIISYLPPAAHQLDITYYGLRLDGRALTNIIDLTNAVHQLTKTTQPDHLHPLLVHDQGISRRIHHPAPVTVLQTHQLLNYITTQDLADI